MDVPAKDYVKAPSSNYIDLVSLRISKELGRGGFASCWAATYNGRNVAVKVLKARPKTVTSKARIGGANGADAGHVVTRKLPNDDDDLYDRMFLREAQLMMKLEHRHLVRCFGVTRLPAGSIPRQPEPALAMLLELCEVNTIRDLITQSMTSGRRVYKEKQAYVWLLQVASALAHLHNQKPPVIHRDIKPDNVLLCRDYSDGGGSSELICKITDLGLHVAISEDRPAMLRRSMKHPAFNVKQQNTPPPPCNTPPPAGNTPAATSAAAAAAVATPAASASIVAVAGGSSLPSTPKRTSPPLRRQASSITAIGSNGCQAAAAVAAGIADESSDGMENVERSPFLKVSAGPSFASSPRPAKREATNTCCWVRDELGMSLDGATSGAVSPIVQQPSYSSGANSQADGIGATNNNNYCTNNVNEPAALKPKPELDPTQLGKVLPQQQPQQQQGGQQGGQQQQQQQQQHNREFEMYGDGNQATSSARPVGLLSASEKLSALLIPHPDLVEPVPVANPAVGLRDVAELLQQFGASELTPLRRRELEWVFGLTGKAGSLMYMAPEVFRNQPYNEKSDVFSFGVLAYELLAWEVLSLAIFNTGRASRLGVQHVSEYAALVARGYRPARVRVISDAAWALIESCWHQDPVQRPSMDQAQAELQRLVDELEDTKEGNRGCSSKQRLRTNAKQQQQQQQQQLPHQRQQLQQRSGLGGSKRAPRVVVGDTAGCGPCAIC